MSNWFKRSQYDEFERDEFEQQAAATRYRLVFPIDVFFISSGDPNKDREIIYQEVKNAIGTGFENTTFEGYSDYLQLSDIKTYDEVMGEIGL